MYRKKIEKKATYPNFIGLATILMANSSRVRVRVKFKISNRRLTFYCSTQNKSLNEVNEKITKSILIMINYNEFKKIYKQTERLRMKFNLPNIQCNILVG